MTRPATRERRRRREFPRKPPRPSPPRDARSTASAPFGRLDQTPSGLTVPALDRTRELGGERLGPAFDRSAPEPAAGMRGASREVGTQPLAVRFGDREVVGQTQMSFAEQ